MSLVKDPKHDKVKLVDVPVGPANRRADDETLLNDSSKTLAPSNKGSRRKVQSHLSKTASSADDGQQSADPRGSDMDSKQVQRARRASPAKSASQRPATDPISQGIAEAAHRLQTTGYATQMTVKRPPTDPIDEALEAANYEPVSLEDAISRAQSKYVGKPLSKQQRALLQEQDRREQYLAHYLDGEINLSWRVAVIVLLVFIGLAAAKSWADAFMTLSIFMVGYLLHAVIMVVRLKRDADA